MSFGVLSAAQIEEFSERGWTRLQGAFSSEAAAEARAFLWDRLRERGVQRDDQATWTTPMVHLMESYSAPEFEACNTPRLKAAVEELVGEGRWRHRDTETSWGWWPVNFPRGADANWDVTSTGWHWDGQHFRHYINSPEQGLLLLCCFSTVRPRGGGTLVASGSHKIVARYLSQFEDGQEHTEALRECPRQHPWLAELVGITKEPFDGDSEGSRMERFFNRSWTDDQGTELRVEEIIADPGDVYLCHPFLYHSTSYNLTGEPRIMCNRTTPLKCPMELERADGDYSPLEISIRRALSAPATQAV